MLRKIFFLLFLLFSISASAQKLGNRFFVKFSDGSQYDMPLAGAIFRKDSSFTLLGNLKGEINHALQVQLLFSDKTGTNIIKRGYYHFNYKQQNLDYIPGESFGYRLKGYFIQQKDGVTMQEWITENDPLKGFVEIEAISDTRVKGRFSFELVQRFPSKGSKILAEGNFDLKITTLEPK